MSEVSIRGVLFDLDGTLADTAPDLAAALNRLRNECGLPALPDAELRPHTSAGARGMIGAGFGLTPGHTDYPALVERFLALYADALCVHTRLFDGMAELLARLEAAGLPWGIVTNKAARFTEPLMQQLGLSDRAASIVSGDSVPNPKPDPAGLRLAAQTMGLAPEACVYIGDDERDIIAARAAAMRSVTAAYGYLGCAKPHAQWGADHTIHHPLELLPLLQ